MNPIKSLTDITAELTVSCALQSLVAFNRRSGLVNSFTMEVMAIPARSLENIQGEPGAPPGQSHEMAIHGAVKGESGETTGSLHGLALQIRPRMT